MSALTKHCSIIQAHRSFFGTFLLLSDRGGGESSLAKTRPFSVVTELSKFKKEVVWVFPECNGCQKAFTVVQCLAHDTTAGDRESNRFRFGASR